IGLFTNKYLILSLLLGIIIQVVIITVPFFSNLFKVYSLSFTDWILVFLISIIPLAVNELLKLHLRR
ncbi:MAG: cation transporting ATPase C-terminal domain-containing protein, partial [Clostridium celatum]|nr:cation transporting ATPase C-terminal domain-containing protein [Clostridium celatum]